MWQLLGSVPKQTVFLKIQLNWLQFTNYNTCVVVLVYNKIQFYTMVLCSPLVKTVKSILSWFVMITMPKQSAKYIFDPLSGGTCYIYCMSVHPGRGIPPLWLFLRFPPSFFTPLFKVFFSHYGKFFITRIEGLKTQDVIHCTDCKAHWGNVIVILGCIDQIDLIWFDLALCKNEIKHQTMRTGYTIW